MIEGLKKVLVIGSGPIIIGQAAEFDYAGTQACRALKEEGFEVVLINSNPATIMATEGTGAYFQEKGIDVEIVKKIHEEGKTCAQVIRNGKVDLMVNTLTYGKRPERDGFNLRRMAVELAVPCLTSLDTAREVLRVVANRGKEGFHDVAALQDYDMEA